MGLAVHQPLSACRRLYPPALSAQVAPRHPAPLLTVAPSRAWRGSELAVARDPHVNGGYGGP
jgi:hypothetical protein